MKKSYIISFILVLIACLNYNSSFAQSKNIHEKRTSHPKAKLSADTLSFDYSQIASHPRLFFSNDDEKLLKNNLKKDESLMKLHEAIIRSCDAYLDKPLLKRELIGIRLLKVSREALQRIFYLSYAFRMTDDVKYLKRAELEINNVCDYSDWNPSHFLDVAEMTAAVAIGYDWLYRDLKIKTRRKVEKSIVLNAFEPSKNQKYNYFLRMTNNWNSVCNGGLTLGALAVFEKTKHSSIEIIERAIETNKKVLATYAPDGNYVEGYAYWDYGTNYQIMFLSALESALGSDCDLNKSKGFLETSEFMLHMAGSNGLCFNYSDCQNEHEISLVGMFWFARKTEDLSLLYTEKKKMKNGAYIEEAGKNRFLPFALLFSNSIDFNRISTPEKKIWVGLGKSPVALIRDDWSVSLANTFVGVKGGKANLPHGQMDAASFVYDKNGVRWAMDFGAENYNSLESNKVSIWNYTQNSTRWNVFRYNNKAHNTLTINDQLHLTDGLAEITNVYDNDKFRGVDINMTPLFGDAVAKSIRTIGLDQNNLLVKDVLRTTNDSVKLRWNMLTPAIAYIDSVNHRIILKKDGREMTLVIHASQPILLKTWDTTPRSDFESPNEGTVMVGFESVLPPNTTCDFTVNLIVTDINTK